MLSKKCSENDVRQLFGQFGTIEECTVLRDTNNQSKGCAFVTYTSKQCAINAIKAMHHSQTMEGCSSPLVVKFADTQKEKDQKRLQQMQANLWNLAGVNMPQYLPSDSHSMLSPSNLQLLQQVQSGHGSQTSLLASLQQSMLMQQQLQAVQSSPGLHGLTALQNSAGLGLGLTGSSPNGTTNDINQANLQGLATLANLSVSQSVNPMSMQNLVTLAAMTGGNGANLQVSPSGSLTGTSAGSSLSPVTNLGLTGSPLSSMASLNSLGAMTNGSAGLDSLTSAYQQYADMLIPTGGFSQFGSGLGSGTGTTSGTGSITGVTSDISVTSSGKQLIGPEGANLFIYHLPQEFSDSDLISAFLPFGTVLSAKVYIDKHTNISKCFGFVSYDNAVSAQAAISAMNGFQIGSKRLKVQHKRGKEASRPY